MNDLATKPIFLVIPPGRHDPTAPSSELGQVAEPLGLCSLAAVLRERGFRVAILDSRVEGLDEPQLARMLTGADPLFIGVALSFAMTEVRSGLALIAQLRDSGCGCHIIAGGHTATHLHERLLNECPALDSICIGEGEHTVVSLANALCTGADWRTEVRGLAYRDAAGRPVLGPPAPPCDLDSLPFPARDPLVKAAAVADAYTPLNDLAMGRHCNATAQVETSRGCWGRCAFCAVPRFFARGFKPWRAKSATRICDEIEFLIREHGINIFDLVDDNFIGPGRAGRERVLAFVEEVKRRGLRFRFAISCRVDSIEEPLLAALKGIGLIYCGLGIESGAQTVLDRLGKRTTVQQNLNAIQVFRRLGVHLNCNLIMFDPELNVEELRTTIAFLRATGVCRDSMRPTMLLNRLILYPGTRVRDQYLSRLRSDASVSQEYFLLAPFQDEAIARIYHIFSSQFGSQEISDVNTGQKMIIEYARRVLRFATVESTSPPHLRRRLIEAIMPLVDRFNAWYNGLGELNLEVLDTIVARVTGIADCSEAFIQEVTADMHGIRREYDRARLGCTLAEFVHTYGNSIATTILLPGGDADTAIDLASGAVNTDLNGISCAV